MMRKKQTIFLLTIAIVLISSLFVLNNRADAHPLDYIDQQGRTVHVPNSPPPPSGGRKYTTTTTATRDDGTTLEVRVKQGRRHTSL